MLKTGPWPRPSTVTGCAGAERGPGREQGYGAAGSRSLAPAPRRKPAVSGVRPSGGGARKGTASAGFVSRKTRRHQRWFCHQPLADERRRAPAAERGGSGDKRGGRSAGRRSPCRRPPRHTRRGAGSPQGCRDGWGQANSDLRGHGTRGRQVPAPGADSPLLAPHGSTSSPKKQGGGSGWGLSPSFGELTPHPKARRKEHKPSPAPHHVLMPRLPSTSPPLRHHEHARRGLIPKSSLSARWPCPILFPSLSHGSVEGSINTN